MSDDLDASLHLCSDDVVLIILRKLISGQDLVNLSLTSQRFRSLVHQVLGRPGTTGIAKGIDRCESITWSSACVRYKQLTQDLLSGGWLCDLVLQDLQGSPCSPSCACGHTKPVFVNGWRTFTSHSNLTAFIDVGYQVCTLVSDLLHAALYDAAGHCVLHCLLHNRRTDGRGASYATLHGRLQEGSDVLRMMIRRLPSTCQVVLRLPSSFTQLPPALTEPISNPLAASTCASWMKQLRQLSLLDCCGLCVTDQWIASVAELGCLELRRLELHVAANLDTAPSDTGLAKLLANCPQLEWLDASSTRFGLKSFKSVISCSAAAGLACCPLAHLRLDHCPKLSFSGKQISLLAEGLAQLLALTDLSLSHTPAASQLVSLLSAHHHRPASPASTTPSPAVHGLCRRLRSLHIRGCSVTAAELAGVLHVCTALHSLDVAVDVAHMTQPVAPQDVVDALHRIAGGSVGCTDGSVVRDRKQDALQLHKLHVGWGCGGSALQHMWSTQLRSIHIGVGATVSDHMVLQMCLTCLQLTDVTIHFGQVSDEGLCALVSHCAHLSALSLLNCSGPFTDAVEGAVGRRRGMPWSLTSLSLVNGAEGMTNRGARALVQAAKPSLEVCEFVGMPLVGDEVLEVLLQHCSTLRELRLERVRQLSAAALKCLLLSCPVLRSLRIHHCCRYSVATLDAVLLRCRLLEFVGVDSCDISNPEDEAFPGSLLWDPGVRSPLRHLHVRKCRTMRTMWRVDEAAQQQQYGAVRGQRYTHAESVYDMLHRRFTGPDDAHDARDH